MEISIIIPVYNGADTIIRTLDSIFNQQEAKNVEVIVINDCSTDATHSILSNYPPDKINSATCEFTARGSSKCRTKICHR